jgi:ABC-type transport system involved in multi-copper enzyme maturation permease subunit
MLWYKSWLETRWRFLIGLALLVVVACGNVFEYPQVLRLMPAAAAIDANGQIGRAVKEAAELSSEFRGHIWFQWFRQNLAQLGTLLAALLGSGGLLAQSSGGAALFTLSLPVSRRQIVGVRAATGLAELLALAVIPSLMIPLVAPAIGQSYSVGDAIVHAGCMFVGSAVFFSLAILLSTEYSDLWRPVMITCFIAVVLSVTELLVRDVAPYGIFRVMSAETYFRGGGLPWIGLLGSLAAAVAMLYTAGVNIAHRDF